MKACCLAVMSANFYWVEKPEKFSGLQRDLNPSPSCVLLFRVSHGVVFQLGNVFSGNFVEPYAICLPPPPQLRYKPMKVYAGQYEKR